MRPWVSAPESQKRKGKEKGREGEARGREGKGKLCQVPIPEFVCVALFGNRILETEPS
jgi:hypothetical protein